MAGASDPLEDMLFSEVDEKAVSDLVGSLESELTGQSNPAAPHTEIRSTAAAGAANHHLGRMLPVQVGTILQQQQQQEEGQHKAVLNQESSSKALSSGKTVIPSSLSSIPPFEGASITSGTGVNASSSGLQSHGVSNITALAAPGLTLPPPLVSINPANRSSVLGLAGATTAGAAAAAAATATADPLKNHIASTIRTAPPGIQSLNGNGGVVVNSAASVHFSAGAGSGTVQILNNVVNSVVSTSSTVNSNLTVASSVNTTAFSATQTVFPAGQADRAGTPTIALQRPPPSHITNISQNGNGTVTSTLIQSGARVGTPVAAGTQLVNHKIADASSIPKTDSPAQSKIVMPSQPCVVNSLMNPTTSAPVMNPPTSQPHSSIANSLPAVSSTVPLNTVAKPATVNIVGPPLGAPVGVVRPGTPSPSQVMPTPAHPQQPRPGVGAPQQRLVAPQLIVRPPQQTTIQLPPGFTIPQVRQSLQLAQCVNLQASSCPLAHTYSGGPGTYSWLSVAPPTIRPGHPVQTKIVQPPVTPVSAPSNPVLHTSLSPAPASKPSTASVVAVSAAAGSAPQQPVTVITGGQNPPQPASQPLPAQPAAQITAATPGIPGSPAAGVSVISQEMQENVKKCKNFLATLIKLASHNSPSPETSRNVKALVQDLLDAKIEPEEFTNRLQTELKSSPQPYLVPFLKKSLPALRQSLLNSQQSLIQTQQPAQLQQAKPTPGSQPVSLSATGTVPTTGPTVRISQPNSTATTLTNVMQHTQVGVHSQGTVGKAPIIQASKGPGGFAVQVSANQKNKLNDPGGGSFRDDDDINDVASMAGVNLNEESARILATNSDLVGTQIRSCKDEAFIPPGLLHKRILETVPGLSLTECVWLYRLARFEIAGCEHPRRRAKSRSRQEDPEQARLKQKAKEMQQQELAQMRQRDANLTALAAIGPRKKRKLDSPGAAAAGAEVSGSSSGSPSGSAASSSRQYSRQRITRVNLRDFIFYMEEERETSHSLLLYRALLK
ncbi:Transcription initiation factor TFIID subunit 4 [Acipenser ruthenus]|uniref:Transcription initiation factor TFIID subunit 4 n=1 Tax=Acipenser ruthenus TaxID=7906 RepID=A0A444UBP2_ACIRT|nr:Transcription initiation factor TFIID subunit 4 [Acipenser ruthenus]